MLARYIVIRWSSANTLVTEEPDDIKGHVRICGGRRPRGRLLPRIGMRTSGDELGCDCFAVCKLV